MIAKAHAKDRSDIFVTMKGIASDGFGPESEFAIPKPLAYLSSLNVLFEEKVQGTEAMDSFLKAAPASRELPHTGVEPGWPDSTQLRHELEKSPNPSNSSAGCETWQMT